jgi:5-methylcytosine-specific restriction endonuclease McrA
MPTSPASLCRDCTHRAEQGSHYCAAHQTRNRAAEYKQALDRNRKNDPLYNLYRVRRWTKGTRLTVLRRDPLCKECGHRASTIADHIIPAREIVEQFGINAFYDPSRCQGLCAGCHAAKSAREGSFLGKQTHSLTPSHADPCGV